MNLTAKDNFTNSRVIMLANYNKSREKLVVKFHPSITNNFNLQIKHYMYFYIVKLFSQSQIVQTGTKSGYIQQSHSV
jgi:hypothetical protein